jgi:hypothetical protein
MAQSVREEIGTPSVCSLKRAKLGFGQVLVGPHALPVIGYAAARAAISCCTSASNWARPAILESRPHSGGARCAGGAKPLGGWGATPVRAHPSNKYRGGGCPHVHGTTRKGAAQRRAPRGPQAAKRGARLVGGHVGNGTPSLCQHRCESRTHAIGVPGQPRRGLLGRRRHRLGRGNAWDRQVLRPQAQRARSAGQAGAEASAIEAPNGSRPRPRRGLDAQHESAVDGPGPSGRPACQRHFLTANSSTHPDTFVQPSRDRDLPSGLRRVAPRARPGVVAARPRGPVGPEESAPAARPGTMSRCKALVGATAGLSACTEPRPVGSTDPFGSRREHASPRTDRPEPIGSGSADVDPCGATARRWPVDRPSPSEWTDDGAQRRGGRRSDPPGRNGRDERGGGRGRARSAEACAIPRPPVQGGRAPPGDGMAQRGSRRAKHRTRPAGLRP